ncbi:ubiquitin-protein ligase molybdopterin-converting factor [Ophiostoma piceae UAMH 11346]|uniref:Ubiquitin-protein ligase molybdopterin-converting factor n=1 Tax=Ophiostoma piceae (strain UAMH 11346) TaxID=1262450 RepID=S3C8T9_OPHP1|nr:ubiquitin-protein ligase molybdopterin-converting factor [Ophiostoma piceae UAMH 11346]
MSLLAQASNSRPLQLAATAVVSGAVAAGLLLGFQQHTHASRLRRLKEDVEEEVAEEEKREREHEKNRHLDDEVEITDPEDLRALALARRAQAGDYAEDVILEQLTRNQAFLTPAGLAKVRGATVIVVGCGGVGSHCCAALARSGVARIRLVDFDQVSLSSLNRHAVATLADVGRPKVHVLSRRLLAVSPWVRFDLRRQKFDAESAAALLGPWRDSDVDGGAPSDEQPISFIIDAIDNIDTKVELLRYCHANNLPIIASMGAGTKSDPTRVVVGDIGSSSDDRLSRATRRRLKLLGITSGIPAVYSTETTAVAGDGRAALMPLSDEQFAKGKDAVRELGALPDFRVRILPVLGTMPAVFGYTLANHVLLTLSGYPHEYSAVKGRDKLYDQILASVHGFEEKLVRHYEAAAEPVVEAAETAETTETGETPAEEKKKKNKKNKASVKSLAYGLRVPLTPGDIAFLVEEVYRGRSIMSGLPTRTTLVRWELPAGADKKDAGSLFDRVQPAAEDLEGDMPLQAEQRCSRLRLSDLVCMTREEASRHQDLILLKGQEPASLYDAATLASIDARRQEIAQYEQYRV